MTPAAVYLAAGLFLAALGLGAVFLHRDVVQRLIALNVASGGIFLVIVATAERAGPDAVARALVVTGIVVAVSVTGAALAMAVRLAEHPDGGRS